MGKAHQHDCKTPGTLSNTEGFICNQHHVNPFDTSGLKGNSYLFISKEV